MSEDVSLIDATVLRELQQSLCNASVLAAQKYVQAMRVHHRGKGKSKHSNNIVSL
jgi:hypothetical protein